MSKRNGSLSLDQLRAVGLMAGADAAELDGLDAEAVVGWLVSDTGFVTGLNRAKIYRQERLRAEILSLTTRAVKTLRQMVSDSTVPSAVRLRASLAILQAADAMKAETIGSTSARGVQAAMDHRALLESLGG